MDFNLLNKITITLLHFINLFMAAYSITIAYYFTTLIINCPFFTTFPSFLTHADVIKRMNIGNSNSQKTRSGIYELSGYNAVIFIPFKAFVES